MSAPTNDARSHERARPLRPQPQVAFPTRRGTLRAVDDVSFDIAAGEVLGVVGESGAGKSLTGAAVIGLLEPPGRIVGGEVRLSGQRIDNLPPEEMRRIRGKRIGMVFQDPLTSLNPLYRIGDQLVETIRTHVDLSEQAARKRAIALLQRSASRAGARIDSYPHEFSGGMRQRVVLALALVRRARAADRRRADHGARRVDPGADHRAAASGSAASAARAVMLITHDMGVIAETADRVAVMYAGRIAEIGPVRDVVQHPRHPYAKGLMGAIPTLAGDASRLVQIPGSMPRLDRDPAGLRLPPALRARLRRAAASSGPSRCRPAPRRRRLPAVATAGAPEAAA